MKKVFLTEGHCYRCVAGCGTAIGSVLLKQHLGEKSFNVLWSKDTPPMRGILPCPSCKKRMHVAAIENTQLEIDLCRTCYLIWFDDKEFSTMLKKHKSLGDVLPEQQEAAHAISQEIGELHSDIELVKDTIDDILFEISGTTRRR